MIQIGFVSHCIELHKVYDVDLTHLYRISWQMTHNRDSRISSDDEALPGSLALLVEAFTLSCDDGTVVGAIEPWLSSCAASTAWVTGSEDVRLPSGEQISSVSEQFLNDTSADHRPISDRKLDERTH